MTCYLLYYYYCIKMHLRPGSLCVNNCTSFSLVNVCKAGGTTQHVAKLICTIFGFICSNKGNIE